MKNVALLEKIKFFQFQIKLYKTANLKIRKKEIRPFNMPKYRGCSHIFQMILASGNKKSFAEKKKKKITIVLCF